MKIVIDDWYEMLVVGVLALAAVVVLVSGIRRLVLAVLEWLRRGGRLKAGPLEAGTGSTTPCAPYVAEHTKTLERLEGLLGEVKALLAVAVERINQNDEATGALIASSRVVAKWIRRELGRIRNEQDEINGDLEEADDELDRAAAVYRQGRKVVGG
jgi:hypothetical protein